MDDELNAQPLTLQSARYKGQLLEVTFRQTGDRYCHEIALVDGDSILPLLTSIEGDAVQLWPSSPPFQQLNIQEIADNRVALLVGKAGKSHWSASVETDSQRPQITFDIACRLDASPEMLTSKYHISAAATPTSPSSCRISTGKTTVTVSSLPADDTPAAELIVDNKTLSIACPPGNSKFPATWRWRYRVTLE